MKNKLDRIFEQRGTRPNERRPQTEINDPRIDSPEIQVVYPSEQQAPTIEKVVDSASETTLIDAPVVETPVSKTDTPKQGLQEAIEQNFKSFIAIGLVVFSLGFLIGKVK